MKVLVVGANGQIGKHLITYMKGHEKIKAKAMIRDEAQADFFHEQDADVFVCDVKNDVPVIAEAAKDCDAIVFTAGSGPHTGKDKTLMVDLDGAVKTIQAAEQAGVKRYVMISSFYTTRAAIQVIAVMCLSEFRVISLNPRHRRHVFKRIRSYFAQSNSSPSCV